MSLPNSRSTAALVEGWAYGAVYRSSRERRLALPAFLDYYNNRRPHRSLSGSPPAQRLAERNNVVGTYT